MSDTIIDRGRGPEIAGTRITVYDVLDYVKLGWHHATIAATLQVSSDQVLAAIEYIKEHEAEVTAEYEEMLEHEKRGNPPEIEEKLKATRAKMQAWLEERRREKARNSTNGRDSG